MSQHLLPFQELVAFTDSKGSWPTPGSAHRTTVRYFLAPALSYTCKRLHIPYSVAVRRPVLAQYSDVSQKPGEYPSVVPLCCFHGVFCPLLCTITTAEQVLLYRSPPQKHSWSLHLNLCLILWLNLTSSLLKIIRENKCLNVFHGIDIKDYLRYQNRRQQWTT